MASDLTPAERKLIDCAAKGEWWEPEKVAGKELDMDPANADKWGDDRTIRASIVRCLLLKETWKGESAPWAVDPKGVLIEGAKISEMFDVEGATLDRMLWLHSCHFDAQVMLSDSTTRTVSFRGSHLPRGLNMSRAHVHGDLYLGQNFKAGSMVDLSLIEIDGSFACESGAFESKSGKALDFNGATVGASVHLSDGFKAEGAVLMVRAYIEGQLSCRRGTFHNAGGEALNLNSATVGSSALFDEGFEAKGGVILRSATIRGQVSCDGGTFHRPGGKAIDLDSARIGADVFLRWDFKAIGTVDCIRLEVTGNMRCEDASFSNPDGDALDLAQAVIGGGLFLTGLRALDGHLRLNQARCRTFRDDRQSWPRKGKLSLDGFVYERFDECAADYATRREWLELQDRDHLHARFRPQPWTQVINVLRAMGHEGDAKKIGAQREWVRAGSRNTGFIEGLWLRLLALVVGNGYKPWRAVGWSAAFVLIGWFVFTTAAMDGYIAPRDGNVRVTDAWNLHHTLPGTYPAFNGLVYALDAYLPVIEFEQDESWEPSLTKTVPVVRAPSDWTMLTAAGHLGAVPQGVFAGGWHRVLYWVEEFLGWVFVSLFIAGMSGIMKKE